MCERVLLTFKDHKLSDGVALFWSGSYALRHGISHHLFTLL